MNGIVLAVLMLGSEVTGTPVAEPPMVERAVERPRLQLPTDLVLDTAPPVRPDRLQRQASSSTARPSSTTAKIFGIALGAVGGFYAGGMIGYGLTQDRSRDDDGVSGLRGVVIGAPLGAFLGGLIGYQVAK